MNQDSETAFLRKAHAAYIESLERLDAPLLVRLRAGRTRALASVTSPPSRWRNPAWSLPLGALAALLLVVAIGTFWWNPNAQPTVPFAAASTDNEDMTIVLGNDNLDMYADMDFYRWLQSQPQSDAPASDSRGNNEAQHDVVRPGLAESGGAGINTPPATQTAASRYPVLEGNWFAVILCACPVRMNQAA